MTFRRNYDIIFLDGLEWQFCARIALSAPLRANGRWEGKAEGKGLFAPFLSVWERFEDLGLTMRLNGVIIVRRKKKTL